MATSLSLLVPGLLGRWASGHARAEFPRPAAPALEWLLARAEIGTAPRSADATLFQLFGLPIPDTADLPVAAVTRLADGGEADDGWWLRADPVHLRPDQRGIFLVDARVLAIELAEAQALVEAFNHTFAADGLRLDPLRLDRWYLRLPADSGSTATVHTPHPSPPPQGGRASCETTDCLAPPPLRGRGLGGGGERFHFGLRTHPLFDAIGRDINPLLPYGPSAQRWHALLTEIQMLFHHHPVNRAREERNQPLINSVWFWGGGVCPSRARTPAAGLYAADPLTCGLARLANVAVSPVPEHAGDWFDSVGGEPDSLVVLETTRHDPADGDLTAWADHVAELEYAWFAFCRRWLQTGKLTTLRLYPGNGRVYTLTSAARWWFWRRPRPLADHLR